MDAKLRDVEMRVVFVLMLTLTLVAGFGLQKIAAQSIDDEKYVRETGHYIRGEFLTAYYRLPNYNELYGFPITAAYPDGKNGLMVQYFQKVRFELHPEAAPDQRIKISPLGVYLYKKGAPEAFTETTAACRTFSADGFKVCFAFLKFFDDNGGVAQFGNPISNAEKRSDERIVQYFERARLEWHPELPNGQRVVVGDLGREYFDFIQEDPSYLRAEQERVTGNSPPAQNALNLKVRAYTQYAVTGSKGSQTVYVIVQDQRLMPVENARVDLIITMPSGEKVGYIVQAATNEQGIVQYKFDFDASSLGVVTIQVQVVRGNLQQQTITSFRIWW